VVEDIEETDADESVLSPLSLSLVSSARVSFMVTNTGGFVAVV